MRLWSLHPKYLDTAGLNGLWREACMARNALEEGKDHGYYEHPQLDRFKKQNHAQTYIHLYLKAIYEESVERGFNFDKEAFQQCYVDKSIAVANKQLDFEVGHLKNKLKDRDSIEKHNNLTIGQRHLDLHPLFYMINGPVADWEKGANNE